MPDPLAALLLIAAILVVADQLLAGGAMTMTGMSMVVSTVAHPLAAGVLIVLMVVLLLHFGGPR